MSAQSSARRTSHPRLRRRRRLIRRSGHAQSRDGGLRGALHGTLGVAALLARPASRMATCDLTIRIGAENGRTPARAVDARPGADKTEAMAVTGIPSARTPARRPAAARRGEGVDRIRRARRPGRLTAAYALALRSTRRRLRGRRHGRRHRQDGRVQRLPFDFGGHRFFTKLKQVERMWEHLMGDDFLTRPRLSRIYYAGKYFSYPLTAKDVLGRLGLWESVPLRALLSLGAAQARAEGDLRGLGDRPLRQAALRRVLPLLHAEGLGIPGTEIRSLWAARRSRTSPSGRPA